MRTIGRQRARAIWFVAATVAVAAALLAGAGSAVASPSSLSESTSTCWKDVINDWLQHEPNVVGTYPISCYTQALQKLNSYQDIRGYSNAPDDIRRALYAALHNEGRGGSGPSGGNSSGGGSGPFGHNDKGAGGNGFITNLFNKVGPGNAQSVPLPLLVLAGLAFLLLLSAVGTYVAKRIQSRRVAPAPARRPLP